MGFVYGGSGWARSGIEVGEIFGLCNIFFVGVSFIGDHSGVSVFGFWDGFFFFFLVWVLE